MNAPVCRLPVLLTLLALLAGCGGYQVSDVFEEKDGGPDRHVDLDRIPDAIPRIETQKVHHNDPYTVLGKRYTVLGTHVGYHEQGIASWYGNKFHGRPTAIGETYDMFAMTAAHKTLPIPCYAEVTNLENGRKIVVRVNDRGPFHQNRIIDLSYVAAAKLGIIAKGTGLVEVRAIDPRNPQLTVASATAGTSVNHQPQAVARVSHTRIHPNPEIFIQAGAFGNRDNAVRLQTRLQNELGKPVRLTTTQLNNQTYYRVQVGPLLEVSLADDVSLALEQLGISNLTTLIE